jgi:hypothetical protein
VTVAAKHTAYLFVKNVTGAVKAYASKKSRNTLSCLWAQRNTACLQHFAMYEVYHLLRKQCLPRRRLFSRWY